MAKAQSSPRSQTLNSKGNNNNNKVYYLNNKSYHRQSLLVTNPFGASSKFQSLIKVSKFAKVRLLYSFSLGLNWSFIFSYLTYLFLAYFPNLYNLTRFWSPKCKFQYTCKLYNYAFNENTSSSRSKT